MRVAIAALTLLLSVNLAADTDAGLAAYNAGDYETAFNEFKESAEQGDALAQGNLGLMYAEGQGVLRDNVYAHMWANICSFNGGKNGGKLRDYVSENMTPKQIAEAQRLARECVKKSYKDC